jgi:hypothetical protein
MLNVLPSTAIHAQTLYAALGYLPCESAATTMMTYKLLHDSF